MRPVLLDAGPIVALLDRSDHFHNVAHQALQEVQGPLVTCEAVISESCYLLRSVRGAAEAIVENVARGFFQIPFQLSSETFEIQRILRKYRDINIGFADACLICMAEGLATASILTLDADFRVYRLGRNKPFDLLIDLKTHRSRKN